MLCEAGVVFSLQSVASASVSSESVCLSVQKLKKNYWSEIDTNWCEYTLWWTIELISCRWPLTFTSDLHLRPSPQTFTSDLESCFNISIRQLCDKYQLTLHRMLREWDHISQRGGVLGWYLTYTRNALRAETDGSMKVCAPLGNGWIIICAYFPLMFYTKLSSATSPSWRSHDQSHWCCQCPLVVRTPMSHCRQCH